MDLIVKTVSVPAHSNTIQFNLLPHGRLYSLAVMLGSRPLILLVFRESVGLLFWWLWTSRLQLNLQMCCGLWISWCCPWSHCIVWQHRFVSFVMVLVTSLFPFRSEKSAFHDLRSFPLQRISLGFFKPSCKCFEMLQSVRLEVERKVGQR